MQQPVLEPGYCAELGLAQEGRARDDSLEHRLNVGRRVRDRAQDLARRGLPGERLVVLGCTRVELALEVGDNLPGICCWAPANSPHPAASGTEVTVWRARGRRIANSVNSPTRLSTAIVPPCCWVTMSQLIDRPRPVPSPVGLVVKNG
jgi:hypothetical protein